MGCTSSWMWTWDHHRLWNCQESENQDSRLFPLGSEHNSQGVDWTPASFSKDVLLAPQSLLPELVGAGSHPVCLCDGSGVGAQGGLHGLPSCELSGPAPAFRQANV